jgi:hypothetical protein
MQWRTLGRLVLFGRNQQRRTKALELRYGSGGWRIRHEVDGAILDLAEAARHCERSYVAYLERRSELLDWLCANARDVYVTAISNVRSGLDYTLQERKSLHVADIALRNALKHLHREFQGERLLRISGHDAEGEVFAPGRVPFHRPEWILFPPLKHWWDPDSIECFWQSNKVLQVRQAEEAVP